MSVTPSWFGPLLAKARFTLSPAMLSGLFRLHFGRPVTPRRPGTLHQQLDLAVPDRDVVPQGELGMDPPLP
jgi:hypothetical protein